MNILFYVEPWIEKNRPGWKDIWLDAMLLPLHKTIQGFSAKKCFFLVGDAQSAVRERLQMEPDTSSAVISQRELRGIFPDYLTATLSWYRQDATPKQSEQMKQLIKAKLNRFTPDIIISFMMPVPFLAELFPNALVLHMETSGFSRAPYPALWFLDPCGVFKRSFLSKYAAALGCRPLPEEGRKFLSLFRKKFLDRLLIAKNPFTRSELIQNKPLRHLILLPLQVSGYFAFEGNCKFASQWEMLCHVLDHVRPNIGVVVTEHSDWERTLTPEVNAYLKRTYPNYIYLEKFEDYEYPSQFLLQHVDAVATVSSTVGIQALLWQKPICALGDSHISAIADIVGVKDIDAYLDSKAYKPKDNILYYLLSHFYFISDKHMLRNAAWLESHFNEWLKRYRTVGVDENFFGPSDTSFRVLKSNLRAAIPDILRPSRSRIKSDEVSSLQQQLRMQKEMQFHRPLDKTIGEQPIDLANELYFGSGWGFCESNGPHLWRWIEGAEATLHLSLHQACAFSLSIMLAPHKDCPEQTVEVYVGNERLTATTVLFGKWTVVKIEVPKTRMTEPTTRIVLRTNKAAVSRDKRDLSLICKKITFEARP